MEDCQSYFFQVSLDQALLYRLINNRSEALQRVQGLRELDHADVEEALIDYYECLITNEIVIETSEDKLEYMAIDECRAFLNIPDGDIDEVRGERPEDPVWQEILGKRGSGKTPDDDTKEVTASKQLSVSSNISVYPNPASDMLYVKLPNGAYASEIRITDMMGKQVQTFSIQTTASELSVPVQLKNGMYVIETVNHKGIVGRKKVTIVR